MYLCYPINSIAKHALAHKGYLNTGSVICGSWTDFMLRGLMQVLRSEDESRGENVV